MFQHMETRTTSYIYDLMDRSKENFTTVSIHFIIGMIIKYVIYCPFEQNYESIFTIYSLILAMACLHFTSNIIIPSWFVGYYVCEYIINSQYGQLMVMYILITTTIMRSFAFNVPEYIDEFVLTIMDTWPIFLLSCINLSMFTFTSFTVSKFAFTFFSIMLSINIIKNKNKVMYNLMYGKQYMINASDKNIVYYSETCSNLILLNSIIIISIFN